MILPLVSLLLGVPSPDELKAQGLVILSQPQTVQLEPGTTAGTFHFHRPNVSVTFSMKPEFPVRVVAEDYAHDEVFTKTIASASPFDLDLDLRPGTYEFLSKTQNPADKLYWNSDGFQVHIDKTGSAHYEQPPEFSAVFRHRRKIEIISPKNLEMISAKTVRLGAGSDAQDEIPGDHVLMKWKAIPGVKTYTVRLFWIVPGHPNSAYGDSQGSGTTRGHELRLKKDDYLDLHCAYDWVVTDGDEDDLNASHSDGFFAHGSSVFLTPGAQEFFKSQANAAVDGDEWIDARTKVRFRQGDRASDDPTAFVLVEAVGAGSPALEAGLDPGQRIVSLDGKQVRTLDDLRRLLRGIPAGRDASLGFEKANDKWTIQVLLK